MHKIIAPLILLSSLTLLTSCMDRDDTQIPTVKPQKESPVEVDMVTAPIATGTVMTPTPQAKVNPVSSGVLARSKKISYMSPGGTAMIALDVTVTDGVITAASATSFAENPVSEKYQENFTKGLTVVIGKKAKDFNMDAIGGASLTTAAFGQYVGSL